MRSCLEDFIRRFVEEEFSTATEVEQQSITSTFTAIISVMLDQMCATKLEDSYFATLTYLLCSTFLLSRNTQKNADQALTGHTSLCKDRDCPGRLRNSTPDNKTREEQIAILQQMFNGGNSVSD